MLWGYYFLIAGLFTTVAVVAGGFAYFARRRNGLDRPGIPFAIILIGLVLGFIVASFSRLDPEYVAQLHHSKALLNNFNATTQ